MTLYEIDNKIEEAIMRALDPETGELIDEDAWADLDKLQIQREQKCEGIALAYKNATAEAAMIKDEEANLKKRRETAERKADRLKAYLDYALAGDKLNTPRVAVSYRKSKAVQILDERKLPEQYIKTKTAVEPDKAAIKKALTAGEQVPGATLEEKNNLQIK